MIDNISLFTLYVTDQDDAKKWYIDKLGFVEKSDVRMGEGFRWVTIGHPAQPELDITLVVPGPPLDQTMIDAVRRALASGSMGGFGLRTSDCHKAYAELSKKGVEFVQPPADRPYGIEALMRDNSGNWLVLVEPREFAPEAAADFVGDHPAR